jgi:hypothetical protein
LGITGDLYFIRVEIKRKKKNDSDPFFPFSKEKA